MRIGTRSLLYGAHAFWLHPWFVAWGWYRLYGARQLRDPRLWLAFIVHDWGYWGKPNMDGPEGESHPELGAKILWRLTGDPYWSGMCAYHSRFWARKTGACPSPLCYADKMACVLTPAWLYVPMARASGEIWEYMEHATLGRYSNQVVDFRTPYEWLEYAKSVMVKFVVQELGLDKLSSPVGRVQ
jgi:hypothetical protein